MGIEDGRNGIDFVLPVRIVDLRKAQVLGKISVAKQKGPGVCSTLGSRNKDDLNALILMDLT
jgi:hypothetical protein